MMNEYYVCILNLTQDKMIFLQRILILYPMSANEIYVTTINLSSSEKAILKDLLPRNYKIKPYLCTKTSYVITYRAFFTTKYIQALEWKIPIVDIHYFYGKYWDVSKKINVNEIEKSIIENRRDSSMSKRRETSLVKDTQYDIDCVNSSVVNENLSNVLMSDNIESTEIFLNENINQEISGKGFEYPNKILNTHHYTNLMNSSYINNEKLINNDKPLPTKTSNLFSSSSKIVTNQRKNNLMCGNYNEKPFKGCSFSMANVSNMIFKNYLILLGGKYDSDLEIDSDFLVCEMNEDIKKEVEKYMKQRVDKNKKDCRTGILSSNIEIFDYKLDNNVNINKICDNMKLKDCNSSNNEKIQKKYIEKFESSNKVPNIGIESANLSLEPNLENLHNENDIEIDNINCKLIDYKETEKENFPNMLFSEGKKEIKSEIFKIIFALKWKIPIIQPQTLFNNDFWAYKKKFNVYTFQESEKTQKIVSVNQNTDFTSSYDILSFENCALNSDINLLDNSYPLNNIFCPQSEEDCAINGLKYSLVDCKNRNEVDCLKKSFYMSNSNISKNFGAKSVVDNDKKHKENSLLIGPQSVLNSSNLDDNSCKSTSNIEVDNNYDQEKENSLKNDIFIGKTFYIDNFLHKALFNILKRLIISRKGLRSSKLNDSVDYILTTLSSHDFLENFFGNTNSNQNKLIQNASQNNSVEKITNNTRHIETDSIINYNYNESIVNTINYCDNLFISPNSKKDQISDLKMCKNAKKEKAFSHVTDFNKTSDNILFSMKNDIKNKILHYQFVFDCIEANTLLITNFYKINYVRNPNILKDHHFMIDKSLKDIQKQLINKITSLGGKVKIFSEYKFSNSKNKNITSENKIEDENRSSNINKNRNIDENLKKIPDDENLNTNEDQNFLSLNNSTNSHVVRNSYAKDEFFSDSKKLQNKIFNDVNELKNIIKSENQKETNTKLSKIQPGVVEVSSYNTLDNFSSFAITHLVIKNKSEYKNKISRIDQIPYKIVEYAWIDQCLFNMKFVKEDKWLLKKLSLEDKLLKTANKTSKEVKSSLKLRELDLIKEKSENRQENKGKIIRKEKINIAGSIDSNKRKKLQCGYSTDISSLIEEKNIQFNTNNLKNEFSDDLLAFNQNENKNLDNHMAENLKNINFNQKFQYNTNANIAKDHKNNLIKNKWMNKSLDYSKFMEYQPSESILFQFTGLASHLIDQATKKLEEHYIQYINSDSYKNSSHIIMGTITTSNKFVSAVSRGAWILIPDVIPHIHSNLIWEKYEWTINYISTTSNITPFDDSSQIIINTEYNKTQKHSNCYKDEYKIDQDVEDQDSQISTSFYDKFVSNKNSSFEISNLKPIQVTKYNESINEIITSPFSSFKKTNTNQNIINKSKNTNQSILYTQHQINILKSIKYWRLYVQKYKKYAFSDWVVKLYANEPKKTNISKLILTGGGKIVSHNDFTHVLVDKNYTGKIKEDKYLPIKYLFTYLFNQDNNIENL
ncbi:hypothetical protein EDEG_00406 [Edhazardia aedis USNM 41457]|uniref:BRCT domain-containing protein n=1 Tax=Edhazardia aedis (strain USNM 41457) TaxID=1003232 RepID=J9D189_EDHAE|nr:hypothetical protein EDEG_00406 [Edhazardia aedis USNM 41457]|eukprot:EJW01591.1 hypothetical protein EDEG_00406 [Edhazardia aedis USNM 41457]